MAGSRSSIGNVGDSLKASHTLAGHASTADYLRNIGVPDLPPCTAPFDPGYDPSTVEGHLEQSAHLMEILKISVACWMIADDHVTRRKVAAASVHSVPTVTGGGPFEIAVVHGHWEAYIDLCADIGVTRIECGEGFTDPRLKPRHVVKMALERGLEVQYELGKKHGAGALSNEVTRQLIDQGRRWRDAGALQLVVNARESAKGFGLFDSGGHFHRTLADRFARAFGLETVMFEAPDQVTQFALLDHFGRDVHLCGVRLEDLLDLEIYRRGLHSDTFSKESTRHARADAASNALS